MAFKLLFQTFLFLSISYISLSQEVARKIFRIDTTKLIFNKFCTSQVKITKKVLLLKDSLITIETDLAFIRKLLRNSKGTSEKRLLASISNNTSQQEIDAIKIAKDLGANLYLNSIVASLLDQRNCWIENITPPILICDIDKQTQVSIGSFDAGLRQRRYYFNKHMFLSVWD